MKENQLTIINEEGVEELCEILFTHYDADADTNYVVFQVMSSGECSAMRFNPTDENGGELLPIETEEEWEMIEDMLEEYAENLEDEDDCDCGDDCDCNEGSCCGCKN